MLKRGIEITREERAKRVDKNFLLHGVSTRVVFTRNFHFPDSTAPSNIHIQYQMRYSSVSFDPHQNAA